MDRDTALKHANAHAIQRNSKQSNGFIYCTINLSVQMCGNIQLVFLLKASEQQLQGFLMKLQQSWDANSDTVTYISFRFCKICRMCLRKMTFPTTQTFFMQTCKGLWLLLKCVDKKTLMTCARWFVSTMNGKLNLRSTSSLHRQQSRQKVHQPVPLGWCKGDRVWKKYLTGAKKNKRI